MVIREPNGVDFPGPAWGENGDEAADFAAVEGGLHVVDEVVDDVVGLGDGAGIPDLQGTPNMPAHAPVAVPPSELRTKAKFFRRVGVSAGGREFLVDFGQPGGHGGGVGEGRFGPIVCRPSLQKSARFGQHLQ
jgi:hypothetical protein